MLHRPQHHADTPDHAATAALVAERLAVDPARGLSAAEIEQRRAAHGENRIAAEGALRPAAMLLRQFTNVLILVLVAAAVIAGLIGEVIDAGAILIIVLLNAAIGFAQEYRAERALQALQSLSTPKVQVVRDGYLQEVSDVALVPGDVVLLAAGNVVAADLRILEAADLTIDEAALTGESVPVVKTGDAALASETPLGDRVNMAFKGTDVAAGHGRGVVVAIGGATELGRIAALMRERERPSTPLQQRLATFGRRLSLGVLVICLIVLLAGLLRGEPPLLMFLTAISLRRSGGAGGAAGGRHHRPRSGGQAHGRGQRPGAAPAGSRDHGLGHHDLLRQDRHAHPEHHARRACRRGHRPATNPAARG